MCSEFRLHWGVSQQALCAVLTGWTPVPRGFYRKGVSPMLSGAHSSDQWVLIVYLWRSYGTAEVSSWGQAGGDGAADE